MEKVIGATGTTTNNNYGFTSKQPVGSEGWIAEGFKFPTPNKKVVAAQKELEKTAREFAGAIIKNIPGEENYGPVLVKLRQTMLSAGAALSYNGHLTV